MEQIQIQKLKINATNIKNSLTGYNKQLIKLRRDEFRFSFTEDKRKTLRKKEEKLESKTPVQKPLEVIKSKILAGPMSFFDKVKEFFGIVFLGLLINNLPKIINGLKKFFTDNKWIIDAVKFTIKLIGDGIMGMIWLVTEYPKGVQQSMMNELKWAKKEFDKIVNILDGAYKVWSAFYNPGSSSSSSSSQQNSQGSASSSPQSGSNAPMGSSNPQPPQKFARGGTVKTSSGSKTSPNQQSKTTSTSGFKGATPTPMGRKAIESTNAFGTFATVTEQLKEHSILLDGKGGVNENFTDVNESFNQFLINLKDREDKDKKPPTSKIPSSARRTPPSPTSGGVNAPSGVKVDPTNILGAIGSTGYSTGPHLHIETGDGYGGAGGAIPKNVLDNVFIGGVPLSKLSQGDGLGAGRGHKGFDYLANTGTPISIGSNLKFIEYDEGYNAGYGNSLIIIDESGNKYLLGHLSSGPTPGALKKIKDKQKPPVTPLQTSTKIGTNPEDSLMAMDSFDFLVTQVIEKPVPFPQLIRVNNSSESSNNMIPEINPLLLS